jgi:polyether ionophore transport system permease protein
MLGLGLLARMVGDGVPVLAWLRWLSPFGLLELSRPCAGNR